MHRLAIAGLTALVCLSSSATASAQDTEPVESSAGDEASESAGETEPIIDTAGGIESPPGEARGWDEAPGTETEDVLLFVPRVILAIPKYVFVVVFWPIRGILVLLQRFAVVEHIEYILYFNKARTAGWLPFINFFSADGFTFGLDVFHNNLMGHDEELRARARFGGRFSQAYLLTLRGDRFGGTRLWLESHVGFERNPRLLFAGIGNAESGSCVSADEPPSGTACKTYYSQRRVLGLFGLGYTSGEIGDLLKVGATAIFNARDFGPEDRSGDISTEEVYDTALIPGFDDGVTMVEVIARIIYDTRDTLGLAATGAYFEAFGGASLPVQEFQYWHYGVELAGMIDLYRSTRILILRAAVEQVLGEAEDVPFSDLPRLGGRNRLRGYEEAQFRDELAVLGTVEYHFPIHSNIIGTAFFDAGHVNEDYSNFFDNWHFGGGGGLIFGSEDSQALRLEVAGGDGVHFYLTTNPLQAFKNRSIQL